MNDNHYNLKQREQMTPYFRSFRASFGQVSHYRDERVYAPPTIVQPKTKRPVFLILLLAMMALAVAVVALSFLQVLPQLAFFEKVNEAAATDEEAENTLIYADDLVFSLIESFTGTEEAAEAAAAEPAEGETEERELYFYDNALSKLEDAELVTKLAYYAIPISVALAAVLAVLIIIKSIVGLAGQKRRKMSYLVILMLLITLLGVVGGLVWNNEPMSEMTGFLMRSGTNLILGFAFYALLIVEVLALIFSFFAYKSKKKTAPYLLFADGSTAPYVAPRK